MSVSLLLGIPIGYILGYFDFWLKKQIRIIVDTLLSLPTVFIGLVIYALLTRNGPLGETGLLFTIPGIAIGQAILSLPIIIALTATAVETADPNLKITLMSLGANRRQIATSTLWEVRLGILAAAVTATGRVLTEVGISLMVGGNIKWHTRTITTAIALETSKGEFGMGIALGLVLLLIALTVNISLAGLRRRI
jgi:tungstate transport system permease protein